MNWVVKGVIRRVRRLIPGEAEKMEIEKEQRTFELTQREVKKRRRRQRQNKYDERFDYMSADTGIPAETLYDRLRSLRELDIVKIPIRTYHEYGIYRMDDETAKKTLLLIKEGNELREELKWDLRLVDQGKMSMESFMDKSAGYKEILSSLLTVESKNSLAEEVSYLHPETLDEDAKAELAVDILYTSHILSYIKSEYCAFRFFEKSIEERREFFSIKERGFVLEKLNDEKSRVILDDKYSAFTRMSEHYGRDMTMISNDHQYKRFRDFLNNNEKIILKPRFETLGRGVQLIESSKVANKKALYRELRETYRHFLLEGYITQAEELAALNPDSVNTVRIIAYYDGKETQFLSTSMKIGREGSIVDNAGAGGIFVYIDKETGRLNSLGSDKKGVKYEEHPDTGIRFMDYQLPAWDKALQLIRDISVKNPGAPFVGWDIACTADHEWVIVEGNAMTQFFGAQCHTDKGRRMEFLEAVGMAPMGLRDEEMPRKIAGRIAKELEIPVEETMERIRHFESLGIDPRNYYPWRAWELTDEECLDRAE